MPVATILLITANDPNAPLNSLSEESKDIQRTLSSLPGKDYETILVPDTSIKDLIEEFKIVDRQIEVIHYAGHADHNSLRFTDADATSQELAKKIKLQGTVKFVFLNGCATSGQVQFFHEAGVPFVLATLRSVADQKAHWVATQFYQYWTRKKSLKKAMEEVVADAKSLRKNIPFGNERGILLRSESLQGENKELPWGLYTREGAEESDYFPPIKIQQSVKAAKLMHTRFLDQLIFALTKTKDAQFKGIEKLATNIKRSGKVTDESKTLELLKVLPYTLGLRLRQIVSEPYELSTEYYRQLLFDYVFFFETLLHHTVALLSARLWQDKEVIFAHKPLDTSAILQFLQEDRLKCHPESYRPILLLLVDWVQQYKEDKEVVLYKEVVNYLNGEAFQKTANFFFLQKKYYWQRVRMLSEEAIQDCMLAQRHINEAFPHFKFILQFRFASVRGINVTNFRHLPSTFEPIENLVSKLVMNDEEPMPIAGNSMMDNRSVLAFFETDPEVEAESLNLFPFLIDRNVFAKEPNEEIDLYLFTGFFATEKEEAPCFHYASLSHPYKVWQFKDPDLEEVNFLHLGEEARMEHEYNHLMASPWELKNYFDQYNEQFLQHV